MASERPLVLVLVLLSCAVPRFARGDTPTAAQKETARQMMDSGRAQSNAGHHEAALALFQGADAIMHVPTTGLEVAREHLALGHLVEARDALQAVLRMPASNDQPEAFRVARKTATSVDADLVKRIPALQIRIVGNPTQVSVDGAPIPVAALVAPIKVNPGHHVIVATTEAGDTRKEVDVVEGQTTPVDLAATAASPQPEREATAPPDDGTTDQAESSPARRPAVVPWLRWGGIGLAAVGVGVGAVTGVMAIDAKGSAEKGCVNGMCPPPTWSDLDSARTTSTISTIAFCAAGAGAALAVVSFLLHPAKQAPATAGAPSARATVAPWIAPTAAGVRGTF